MNTDTHKQKNFLISPGGVASVALEKLFGKGREPYHLERFNAHFNHERPVNFDATLLNGGKVAYIFGDPFDIALSFFRRGFLQHPYDHCRYIGGDQKILAQKNEWTIEDFLQLGEDPFDIEGQFYSWYKHRDRNYDILFVKYSSLDRRIYDLAKWYGAEERAKEFTFRKRNSNWSKESDEIKTGLNNMFGSFRKFINTLPDTSINP